MFSIFGIVISLYVELSLKKQANEICYCMQFILPIGVTFEHSWTWKFDAGDCIYEFSRTSVNDYLMHVLYEFIRYGVNLRNLHNVLYECFYCDCHELPLLLADYQTERKKIFSVQFILCKYFGQWVTRLYLVWWINLIWKSQNITLSH